MSAMKKPSNANVLQRLAKLERESTPELKTLNTIVSTTAPITSTVRILTGLAENVASNGRIGLSVKPVSLDATYKLSRTSAGAVFTRVVIVRDTQQESDVVPLAVDIYQDASSPTETYFSEIHKGRFDVLYDKTHFIATSTDIAESLHKVHIKLSEKKLVTFNGSADSDTQSGHLYIVLSGDDASLATTVKLSTRFAYHD
jgi:hypothetical protein